VYDAYLGV